MEEQHNGHCGEQSSCPNAFRGLTHLIPGLPCVQARDRSSSGSFLAIMAGRGALIKPWIFQEVREGRELCLTAQERVGVYRQLVSHMKDHFGDDAMGWRKASYFLPWHFDFFCRYRCVYSSMTSLLA